MGLSQPVQINGRRVMIASYIESDPATHKTPMRQAFPPANTEYLGGYSDGKVYISTFAGRDLEATYAMIKTFLKEEGYGDLPLPKDIKELEAFRLNTRNQQVLLFEDNGYVHNPIKILFPLDRRKKRVLTLELHNEAAEAHLLRFHNKL